MTTLHNLNTRIAILRDQLSGMLTEMIDLELALAKMYAAQEAEAALERRVVSELKAEQEAQDKPGKFGSFGG